MRLFRYFILMSVALAPFAIDAQKVVSVNGKYTVTLDDNENVTIRQAKIMAIDGAKADAMEAAFGTLVTKDEASSNRMINGQESSIFMIENRASAAGDWLGDERDPQVTMTTDGEHIFINAEVWGKAREILRGTTNIKWQVLKNIADNRSLTADTRAGLQKIETTSFNSGEAMYVKFYTPIDGYLAIYMVDDEGTTSCLLPYPKDTAPSVRVKRGDDPMFFKGKVASGDPKAIIIEMTTHKLHEYDQLYIIFSPNPFTKCKADKITTHSHMPTLDEKEFREWLLKQQRADKDMVVDRKWIEIIGKE